MYKLTITVYVKLMGGLKIKPSGAPPGGSVADCLEGRKLQGYGSCCAYTKFVGSRQERFMT